jgi:hypothetical protein
MNSRVMRRIVNCYGVLTPLFNGVQKSEGLHGMISQRPIRSINKALGWVFSAAPVSAGFMVQADASSPGLGEPKAPFSGSQLMLHSRISPFTAQRL